MKYGEAQGKGALRRLSGRSPWYRLGASPKALLAYARVSSTQHQVFLNERGAEVDSNFFCIEPRGGFSHHLLYATLESAFGALQKELLGRSYGGGSGPIKVEGADVSSILVLTQGEGREGDLVEAVRFFTSQPTRPLLEELGMKSPEDTPNPLPHRKTLDSLVFDLLGLDEGERRAVYQETARLVWERTAKAKNAKGIGASEPRPQ